MINEIYVVKDVTADVGMVPLFRENEAVAIRDFSQAVTDPNNPMSQNPDDYVLYHVGNYDDINLYVQPKDPQRVITGIEAVRIRAAKMKHLESLHQQIEEIKES